MSRLLIKRILFSPLSSSSAVTAGAGGASTETSLAVRFLVDSCGLPLPTAVSAAASLRLFRPRDVVNAESVLSLLRSHGFSPADLSALLSRRPSLLLSRPDRTLRPKLHFLLRDAGLPPSVLLSSPSFLSRSLDSHLRPTICFLRRFLPSPDDLLLLARRNPWFLTCNLRATVLPNVDRLAAVGVPAAHVAKLLTTHPRALMPRPAAFDRALSIVIGMEVRPKLSLFVHAVRAVNGMSRATWAARMALLERLGWYSHQICQAFRRVPLFVLVSEHKLRRSTEFFAKEVGYGPRELSQQPKLLMYSLEKRIKPRLEVLKALRAKGVVRDEKANVSMFTYDEKSFLQRYVAKHRDKVPELMDVYRGKLRARELVSGHVGDFKAAAELV